MTETNHPDTVYLFRYHTLIEKIHILAILDSIITKKMNEYHFREEHILIQ